MGRRVRGTGDIAAVTAKHIATIQISDAAPSLTALAEKIPIKKVAPYHDTQFS